MIAILQAICYYLVEFLTPPGIRQIRYITRECVSKIMTPNHECSSKKIKLSTRDEDGYPISGYDIVP